jgi:excinuclease ABC subunit B
MRDAAANLEFEEAARLRDEIKRLEDLELAIADDPLARDYPSSRNARGGGTARSTVGGADDAPSTRARKNSLDEMTVRRTEVPAGGRSRAQKPSLDNMGPGTDRETPLGGPPPEKPRSIGGRPGSHVGKRGRR